jgi:flagellar FliL protein
VAEKEAAKEGAEAEGEKPAAAPPRPKAPLILAIVNLLALLGALGTFVYTKMVYQRPAITERGERHRLKAEAGQQEMPHVPGFVHFDKFTVNIRPTPAIPQPSETPSQIKGKQHYATLGFSLQIRDQTEGAQIESIRPLVMDELLTLLGKKAYEDLSTVQGRFLLRSQILEIVNRLLKEPIVTNVFFNEFIVQ